MAVEQERISQEELEVFRKLRNVKVVFDVGARVDIDYVELRPYAQHHLFEPNPEFFKELKQKVGDRKNVFLNNYGLGDREEELPYDPATQSFMLPVTNPKLPIKTLDWYIKEYKIKRIDFLKIDTEGYDYKVLLGGREAIKLCRYIQYEHWNDRWCFHELLNNDFWMRYIGGRNVLCRRL